MVDGAGNTVYVDLNDLKDMDTVRRNNSSYKEFIFAKTGAINYYTDLDNLTEKYILLDYSKAHHNEYLVRDDDGKINEPKTFAAYVNANYKEKFKAFTGLTDLEISEVSFPDENYNETTAHYWVKSTDLSTTTKTDYVKVLEHVTDPTTGEKSTVEKYVDKKKLPYVKARTNEYYFYVCVYDLTLAWKDGKNNDTSKSGVRMIDFDFDEADITASYGDIKDKGLKT